MSFFYACKKCGDEVYVTVTRGDDSLPEACPHCAASFDDTDTEAVLNRADEIAREPLDDDVR